MKAENPVLDSVSVVIIPRLFELASISIDEIKTACGLPTVIAAPNRIIAVNNPPEAFQSSLESHRLEFVNSNTALYRSGEFLKTIEKVVSALSKANIAMRAVGINFFLRFSLDGIQDAGQFLSEKFLKDKEKVSAALGGPIMSSSVRLFWGTKENYGDLRLAPVEFQNSYLVAHHHIHSERDSPLADLPRHLRENMDRELNGLFERLSKL